MIIESIKITNFGLYKGENLIQLKPDSLLNRNITVVSGQNGVGKSTLQEAIHLCLLGSLSIDNRVSESSYEKYLFKRSYKHNEQIAGFSRTSLEIIIQFLKSGSFVKYRIRREWNNDPKSIDEDIVIEEDGKILSELNKKEKNLFLRELIQPGLAKVMFFDGEKLLSLYDEQNLREFIGESCKYLFGLNFIDLLNTDLGYYINKLYTQQDKSQALNEILALKDALANSNANIISLQEERTQIANHLTGLKAAALLAEKQISDQGRWIVDKLDDFKLEKQRLESNIANIRKELVEIYSEIGPFIFCRNLIIKLKDRLLIERDIEKWQHARDLLSLKISVLEQRFENSDLLSGLSITKENRTQLLSAIRDSLMEAPNTVIADERVYHELAENDRMQLLSWIDQILGNLSDRLLSKSDLLASNDEKLKRLVKEQASFSKEDAISASLQEIQDLNKSIGANDQKISSILKRIEEANKKREQEINKLKVLEESLQRDKNVDSKLKLSSKTKMVLEAYASQLLDKKLLLLSEKVLQKFNLLCRKESYLDNLVIDKENFNVSLSRKGGVVEQSLLSAGEKQLLIISFLWGLRELTNIALPLIIDTPLARLDLEHRKAFIEGFLPEIKPQVILIGTDMELTQEVMVSMENHMSYQYQLTYDPNNHSTKITEVERIYKENILNEV